MAGSQPNVCVPMKVEAFRLNATSDDGPSRLAPLAQPDFTRLRLDQRLRHDVLGNVDLQSTANGSAFSNRLTNLATGEQRRERFGMYLHWTLPRYYRIGIAATESSADDLTELRNKYGHPEPTTDSDAGQLDPQSATYRPLPPRWIVLRHLTSKTPSDADIPTFQAFVVESDRLSRIGDLGSDVAIEVDVSPFAYMKNQQSTLAEQAELYIGHKQRLEDWQEPSDPSIVRVPLSILSNVNPVFADYQPHNTNVFSILDNFSYEDNGTKYLEQATANYYVMGWHSNPAQDPFSFSPPPQDSPYPTHADRLKGCYMQLAETKSSEAATWLKTPLSVDDETKVLIHGALYQVEWDVNVKPPTVPADDVAKDYNDFSPVSVGVNPVDALLAVTHSRAVTNDENSNASKADPLAQDILSLQTLIIKQNEDPDSQLQGADILFTSYFVPTDGGQHWHVAGAPTSTSTDRPTVPDPQERDDLSHVNRLQAAVDLSLREARWLQWQIWAEWWKWARSSVTHTDEEKLAVRTRVNDLVHRHELLILSVDDWNKMIEVITKEYNWEISTVGRFFTCRDPTVLLCGMKSGWPTDWNDLLKARLDNQIVTMDILAPPDGWDDFKTFASSTSDKLPKNLQETSKLLLAEFFILQPLVSDTRQFPADLFFPLYHDKDNSEASSETTVELWRDRWNGKQPWFPLFVEWEVEYYHIDHRSWGPASRGPYGPPKLYFEIKADISNTTDSRLISGRSLILPYNNSMLKSMVEKLLKDKHSSEDIDALKTAIDRLDLLTLTLSSISGQLATKQQNTHLKPTINVPGYGPVPLQEAVDACKGVISEDAIRHMYNTTMTPYGDFPDFQNAEYSPFKPVVHGQFRFTKLNVIDKFGQAISAIDPDPGIQPALHPYISEFYSCIAERESGSPVPRTVISDPAQCAQLEPRVNQESRLNGHYVLWSTESKCWRPVTEYESPIWGWLVINYVDNGLQVFLPDGTFYREIRLGPHGTSAGLGLWLPFKAPDGDGNVPEQLRGLVEKLRQDVDYLKAFFDVMVGALDATMFTPNQYAGYLPAITGKPFALVNSGWSLQLSHPPDINQSTSISSSLTPEEPIDSYDFPIKLGDKDRSFDGLLGYFELNSPTDIVLDKFYTYYPGGADSNDDVTVTISEDNYPTFQAFYNDPLKDTNGEVDVKSPEDIDLDYNQRLRAFGMLVDPFTLVHAYSGFLPVTTLRLPEWALEQGLKSITAFFHLGPILMPNDAPPYDSSRVLAAGADLKNIADPPAGTSPFPIPAIGVADWAWLQPYAIDPVSVDNISFNPFKLTAVADEPKFENTPYTAVEGYLYLKQPITLPIETPQDG